MMQAGDPAGGDGHEVARASTTNGLPMDAGLGPTLEQARAPRQSALLNLRVVFLSLVSIAIAAAAGVVAQALTRLIGLITNLSFYGRFSSEFTSPAYNHLGLWVLVIPVIGGVIVGLMARYGSTPASGRSSAGTGSRKPWSRSCSGKAASRRG